jgi:AcrR family transcriptional regulator
MRSLASKLGVAVTSIYWHVGNKEALLDALVDRIGPELAPVRTTGRTPEARILSTARSVLDSYSSHPSLAGLAHERGRLLDLLAPARRALAEAFADAGLHGLDVVDATNAVMRLVGEHAVTETVSARWPVQQLEGVPLWDDVAPVDAVAARGLAVTPDLSHVFDVTLVALVRGLLTH